MKILKIHSKYLIIELFSFVMDNRKFKIIKHNSSLIKKLDLSIEDFKFNFFQKIINKLNYCYIKNYFEHFQEYYKLYFKNEAELKKNIINALSKNENFTVKINDEYLDIMLNNLYFKENIRIDLSDTEIPKLLLVKGNQLTNESIEIFKNIFKTYSTNEQMNKEQCTNLMNLFSNKNDNKVNFIFSKYNVKKNGLLTFDEFIKYYNDLICHDVREVWNNIIKLDYYKNFENDKLMNLLIQDIKINNLTLVFETNEIILEILNQRKVFENIKILDISMKNLKEIFKFVKVFENCEELKLKAFLESDYEYEVVLNDLNIYLPKLKILSIYINIEFDLFYLMNILQNSKIQTLKIIILDLNELYNSPVNSKIRLEKIKNLEIYFDKTFIYQKELLIKIFDYIEFPNLEKYILTFNYFNCIDKKFATNDTDFCIINEFVLNILNNKNNFDLKNFFDLPYKLKSITHLELDLYYFHYIYKKKEKIIIYSNLIYIMKIVFKTII